MDFPEKNDCRQNRTFGEKQSPFDYYQKVIKTKVVKDFFTQESKNKSNYANYPKYIEYIEKESLNFVKQNIHFLVLPKGIKAFTNRYLHIFVNSVDYENEGQDESSKHTVRINL